MRGEGRKEKGERRKVKGEGRKEKGERKTALLYEGRSAATKTKAENYIAICMRSAHSCRNEVRDISSASVKH